ncbi:hypothetical protein BT67DRAFT_441718 [Trichocladium antarcticum]|uniref:Uncharacterized protein n=1 Tax=Trichocladium antarcticum TaxID=1450529 RepID=A0AAN6UK76_9PEZI|nr:hypothetical protein BT67DRAFT_441718 [Trichocladium antarcticum]
MPSSQKRSLGPQAQSVTALSPRAETCCFSFLPFASPQIESGRLHPEKLGTYHKAPPHSGKTVLATIPRCQQRFVPKIILVLFSADRVF